MKKIFALLACAWLLSACAPTPYWTLTDKTNQVVKSDSFQFTAPQEWVRTTEPVRWERLEIDGDNKVITLEGMGLTRDGAGIHSISVMRRYPDTAFPSIKKKSTPDMLPPMAAELYVSDQRKRNGLERLTVVSNKPATVGGKPGFELVTQYKNDDGLRIQVLTYGFVDKSGFYTLRYRAPMLYFYERDYENFKKLVHSFKQLPGAFKD